MDLWVIVGLLYLSLQAEFNERYNGYVERFDTAQARVSEIDNELIRLKNREEAFEIFIRELKRQQGCLDDFDERIWQVTLEKATVYNDGRVVFRFFNGTEIEA